MTNSHRMGHKLDMMYELEHMQEDMMINWLDKSLPEKWTGLDHGDPIDRHQTRITLRMDADMVRWFRKLGPGYQKRINRVLRIYWTALLAGHIQGYPNDNTVPRIHAEAFRVLDEMKRAREGRE
ncbi:MAG: BrnA antitoxin family protein [Pseudomonadota bacterium]